MNNLIECYHYGDCGEYDEFNPFKIIKKKGVPEILYIIGKSLPFTINMSDLNRILEMDIELLSLYIYEMTSLNMLEERLGYYSTNFTIIFNEDLQEIDVFSKTLALKISSLIHEKKAIIQNLSKKLASAEHFDSDELLYHIIGCDILDGSAIETLDSLGLIKTSKDQKAIEIIFYLVLKSALKWMILVKIYCAVVIIIVPQSYPLLALEMQMAIEMIFIDSADNYQAK